MSETGVLYIDAKSKRYPIYVSDSFDGLGEASRNSQPPPNMAFIVTDSVVAPLYLEEVKTRLSRLYARVAHFVFDAGEPSKTLTTVSEILKAMFKAGADRSTRVYALGGGVCGDMAGFAASMFMRGAPYAHIPTTLLSMVDSSVGGKTGIDFLGVKNGVGAFYQPDFVYANTATLNSLPKSELLSGIGEAVKHAIIDGGAYMSLLEAQTERITAPEGDAIRAVVEGSCKIKGAYVEADERDSGKREALNFGHTFGHAIETDSGFTIPHGQCVAIGMTAAIKLSADIGTLSAEDAGRAGALISAFGLMTEYKTRCPRETTDRIIGWMYADKKAKDGKLAAVVLDGIGKPRSLRDVPDNAVIEALKPVLTEE